MRRLVLAALALGLSGGAGRAERLVASLSVSQVAITSNYTGASVVAFGAIERDGQTIARPSGYDVVVTVRGPRQTLTVREKEPLGPIWINQAQQKFAEVPTYLGSFSTRPLDEITSPNLRQRLRVGIDTVIFGPDHTLDRGGADDPFRQALIRLRRQEGLFIENGRGVTFLTPSLFRAPIPIPATAPIGGYEVEVALFADSVLLARTQTHFELVRIGFEQRMSDFARDWSALYGIATAAIALFFGWAATIIFRRD